MARLQRLDSGTPLRNAMAAANWGGPKLHQATKRIDPEGHGVAQALIGFLKTTGSSQRETCSDRSGQLIAEALDVPLDSLFKAYITHPLDAPADSTTTGERSDPDGNPAA
jgi:hypothetical protein